MVSVSLVCRVDADCGHMDMNIWSHSCPTCTLHDLWHLKWLTAPKIYTSNWDHRIILSIFINQRQLFAYFSWTNVKPFWLVLHFWCEPWSVYDPILQKIVTVNQLKWTPFNPDWRCHIDSYNDNNANVSCITYLVPVHQSQCSFGLLCAFV